MIGILTVRRVIRNTVYCVALKEARILSRYEVCNRVREILRHVMPIVGVKGNFPLSVDLRLGRLGDHNSVALSRESYGAVASTSLIAERNDEFKRSVGNVNYRLGKSLVKLKLNELGIEKLNAELIALSVFSRISLIDLVTICLEFNVTVFRNQL